MRTNSSANDLEVRAIEALRAVLKEISVVRLKDIRREAHGSGGENILLAHVDVLGRSHTLACEVKANAHAESLCSSLQAVRNSETETRVIIAPNLSPEAQALCKLNRTGFLDLEGNARIALGEVFIGRRCMARPGTQAAAQKPTQDGDLRKLPARSVGHAAGVAAVCQA